jgi:hypothetical protein
MKKILSLVIALISISSFAQTENLVDLPIVQEKYTAHNKGKFYVYWGGNRDNYAKSDIHFTGNNYDFTLYDVTAQDRPKGWHIDYVNPTRMTIPQTNLRIGYFINDHYNISIGYDHMKYIMDNNVRAKYSGYYPQEGEISNVPGNTFGENATADEITLTPEFLTFEHTDGLNYVNTEINRFDDISHLLRLPNTDKFQINLTEGIGGGFLFPRTNAKVFNKVRYDEFNVAGYGISAKAGLNFTFYKYFFIQTEIKGGYINMNNIRTSYDKSDKAEQEIWFLQKIITVGGIFKL